MEYPDTLVHRARKLEAAVVAEAHQTVGSYEHVVSTPYAEALQAAAERLVPSVWQWRIERTYGGSAVFFITGYSGS